MNKSWIPAASAKSRPIGPLVDIWWVDLAPAQNTIECLGRLLTPSERVRADNFRFDRHRRRFIVRRGALRSLLGSYLELPPDRVDIDVGPHGKPRLGENPACDLTFNLSDSSDYAVVAVTSGAEIGVDIEHLRATRDFESLAEHFFSPAEHHELVRLETAERQTAFYRAWTRKEAFLKAIGTGLGARLDSCRVTLRPDEPARLVEVAEPYGEAECWSLQHLEPPGEFVGALVVERRNVRLRTYRWRGLPTPGMCAVTSRGCEGPKPSLIPFELP